MPEVQELTNAERWVVTNTLKERYGEEIPFDEVESEVRLYPGDRELTLCKGFFWEKDKCHFIVLKTGESKYRSQFFYRIHQQFNTGIDDFDDMGECVITLLQMQADYLAKNPKEGE